MVVIGLTDLTNNVMVELEATSGTIKETPDVGISITFDGLVELVSQCVIKILDGKMLLSELVMDKLLKQNDERIADVIQQRENIARAKAEVEFAAGENMITRVEALRISNLSGNALQNLMNEGKVHFVYVGRNVFFDKQSLLDAMPSVRSTVKRRRKMSGDAGQKKLELEQQSMVSQ